MTYKAWRKERRELLLLVERLRGLVRADQERMLALNETCGNYDRALRESRRAFSSANFELGRHQERLGESEQTIASQKLQIEALLRTNTNGFPRKQYRPLRDALVRIATFPIAIPVALYVGIPKIVGRTNAALSRLWLWFIVPHVARMTGVWIARKPELMRADDWRKYREATDVECRSVPKQTERTRALIAAAKKNVKPV